MKAKNNIRLFCFAAFLSLVSIPVFAATADGSIVGAVQAALQAAAKSQILPQAISWLGSFMFIQMVITNFGLLKSGADLETVFVKLLGSLLWFFFCVYVMSNGANFIDSVGTEALNKFMPTWISPGYILAVVTAIGGSLLTGIGLSGIMVLGSGNPMLALVLTVIMFIIVGVGLYISIKIFMLKLELGLIIVLAPLSFSFLGLNALRDQGIAPFKALISLIYRIILFGIVCTAFKEIGTVTTTALDAISWKDPSGWVGAVEVIFSAMFAFPMLGYLVYKSDAIASSLAGGSTNMGPGDVAAAAAAGAAAGAAVATGGAGAASAATKIPQSMANFMSTLSGGGSLTNASSRGAGGAAFAMPAPPMSSSLSGTSGGAVAPKFETNKAGAPMKPVATGPVSSSRLGDSTPSKQSSPTAEGAAPASGGEANPSYASDIGSTDNAAAPSSMPPPLYPQSQSRYVAGDSGRTASISGQNADSQAANQYQNTSSEKSSFLGHLKEFGKHVEQDKAATHVSINTHHSD